MLGIDIVDLKDPLLSNRTDRTLELIKSPEDVLIEHPHLFWILWSAKEAIFKCRREPINFAPSKIPVEIRKEGDQITFVSNELKGKTLIETDYVISLCGDIEEIAFNVFDRQGEDWSNGIRDMIIDYFKEKGRHYTVGSDDLNLPILLPSKSLISVSHHCRFGAVAFPKKLL
ncbi:4'-phosphopantetheinyl transferase family protein [Ekhidna sp.]